MNWQCPRCETFNRAAEHRCEVCELAKPKRTATKTATKKTSSSLIAPSDLARSDLPVKPTALAKPDFKVIDRRSGALTKPAESKPIIPKTPDSSHPSTPTDVQLSATPGGAITDAILWLLMIGFNIYFLYDFIVNQKLGIGSLILGMIFGNLILLVILGVILEFLKWLSSPPDSTK